MMSKVLESHYVFYDRLKEDGYENLYSQVLNRMEEASEKASQARIDTTFIYE